MVFHYVDLRDILMSLSLVLWLVDKVPLWFHP